MPCLCCSNSDDLPGGGGEALARRILLISKEEKELVSTHLSQSLGHLDATDTSEYLYVSILH